MQAACVGNVHVPYTPCKTPSNVPKVCYSVRKWIRKAFSGEQGRWGRGQHLQALGVGRLS